MLRRILRADLRESRCLAISRVMANAVAIVQNFASGSILR